MRGVVVLLLATLCVCCGKRYDAGEQIIISRIKYVYELKDKIDRDIWEGFSESRYDVPLVYYTDSNCYVSNPTELFLKTYNPELIFKNDKLKVYRTRLLDSIPFHMSVGISVGDPTDDYDYHSPFMHCSSVEITCRTIDDVSSTEEWATMILHEYFHGFQFRHTGYITNFEKTALEVQQDSLRSLYRNNVLFRESIDKENALLLTSIHSKDTVEIRSLISEFFLLRDARRDHLRISAGCDLSPAEQTYETMEGTARWIEYSLYDMFTVDSPDDRLSQSDSCYRDYVFFRDFNFEKAKWLYVSQPNYFYASGFNIVRLLEKLNIEYKSRLFEEEGLSLEKILRESCGS